MEAMHAHNREQMQAALANGAGGFRKWASAGGCTSGSGFRGGGFHGELAQVEVAGSALRTTLEARHR
jgi:hypothetical protein